MKKRSAPKKVPTKATFSVQVVASSFKFLSIVSAILTFFLFISVMYAVISSPNLLKLTTAEVLVKIAPIFAAGFGTFVLERMSVALENQEQEGLFASVTLITFSVLISAYSTLLGGSMSIFAIPVYLFLGVLVVVLYMNKDRFPKDGNNNLVFYTLIYSVLLFVSSFLPV